MRSSRMLYGADKSRFLILIFFLTMSAPASAQTDQTGIQPHPDKEDCDFFKESLQLYKGRTDSLLLSRILGQLPDCAAANPGDADIILEFFRNPGLKPGNRLHDTLYQRGAEHVKAIYLLPLLTEIYFTQGRDDPFYYGLLYRKTSEWLRNYKEAAEKKDPSLPSFEYLSVPAESLEKLRKDLAIIFTRGVHIRNSEIQAQSLTALGIIGSEESLDLIKSHLALPYGRNHYEKDIRLLHDQGPELSRMKTDHSDPLHHAALNALAYLAMPQTASLIKPYLYSEDSVTELLAINALKNVATKEALAYLAERSSVFPLKNPDALRTAVAELSHKLLPQTGYAKLAERTILSRPDSSAENAVLKKGSAVFPEKKISGFEDLSEKIIIRTHTGIVSQTQKKNLIPGPAEGHSSIAR